MSLENWLNVKSAVIAKLDPGFLPAAIVNRHFRNKVGACAGAERVVFALQRGSEDISRYETQVFPDRPEYREINYLYLERIVKFMLWAMGGRTLFFSGPSYLGQRIKKAYSNQGDRSFDVELMSRVYERPFEVVLVEEGKIPETFGTSVKIGGNWNGCRIGFDLGASDYKVVALNEGEEVFSCETVWNPREQADPNYHYSTIKRAIEMAAEKLPRVDAIGGSSAGIIIDNRVMVASLFRAVPKELFDRGVKDIFVKIAREFNVPLVVVNDGDVTALAGALSLDQDGILGIAMGSSQAVGYVDRSGKMTGWLNELAFAPIDYNPRAEHDEWSGDHGVGVSYFSQQAVNKLLVPAGIVVADKLGLAERLIEVQKLIKSGHSGAAAIYETIGVYLGYAIAHYAEFYNINRLLVLGRVASGAGGDMIVDKAREVLKRDFPELARGFELHLPDEQSRRIGQARAAASLPIVS